MGRCSLDSGGGSECKPSLELATQELLRAKYPSWPVIRARCGVIDYLFLRRPVPPATLLGYSTCTPSHYAKSRSLARGVSRVCGGLVQSPSAPLFAPLGQLSSICGAKFTRVESAASRSHRNASITSALLLLFSADRRYGSIKSTGRESAQSGWVADQRWLLCLLGTQIARRCRCKPRKPKCFAARAWTAWSKPSEKRARK